MAVVQCRHDLSEKVACLPIPHTLVSNDVVEQFTARSVFHHNEDLGLGLEDIIHLCWCGKLGTPVLHTLFYLDNVGVSQQLEEAHLLLNALDLPVVFNGGLLDNLDGNLDITSQNKRSLALSLSLFSTITFSPVATWKPSLTLP